MIGSNDAEREARIDTTSITKALIQALVHQCAPKNSPDI